MSKNLLNMSKNFLIVFKDKCHCVNFIEQITIITK